MENPRVSKYLSDRGFEPQGLSNQGQVFGMITAKAKELAPQFGGDNFANTRAIVTEFCRQILTMASNPPKPLGLGKEIDTAAITFAFVKLFSDPVMFDEFATSNPDEKK
jgi:hypothetical protein